MSRSSVEVKEQAKAHMRGVQAVLPSRRFSWSGVAMVIMVRKMWHFSRLTFLARVNSCKDLMMAVMPSRPKRPLSRSGSDSSSARQVPSSPISTARKRSAAGPSSGAKPPAPVETRGDVSPGMSLINEDFLLLRPVVLRQHLSWMTVRQPKVQRSALDAMPINLPQSAQRVGMRDDTDSKVCTGGSDRRHTGEAASSPTSPSGGSWLNVPFRQALKAAAASAPIELDRDRRFIVRFFSPVVLVGTLSSSRSRSPGLTDGTSSSNEFRRERGETEWDDEMEVVRVR
mmetsp:Transcript_2951/g.9674  ORF Transcript_2951/g.9674 Transcript_2951/m.9674 type:complete len:285 (+) Transcript_2951:274-1128(+)